MTRISQTRETSRVGLAQVTHGAQAAHEHRGYRQDKEIDESLQKKICYDPGPAFHHETVDPAFAELLEHGFQMNLSSGIGRHADHLSP
jgi:hypothetical protein